MSATTMLNMNPDIVYAIIDQVREFYARGSRASAEDATVPGVDWSDPERTSTGGDRAYRQAQTGIADLEPDQQICLVALMWLGRGDYTPDAWEQTLLDARERAHASGSATSADYLLGTPLVADYLEAGLDAHGIDRTGQHDGTAP